MCKVTHTSLALNFEALNFFVGDEAAFCNLIIFLAVARRLMKQYE